MIIKNSKSKLYQILGIVIVFLSILGIVGRIVQQDDISAIKLMADIILLVLGVCFIRYFREEQIYVDENYINILRAVPWAKVIAIKEIKKVIIKNNILYLDMKDGKNKKVLLLNVPVDEQKELSTYINKQIRLS